MHQASCIRHDLWWKTTFLEDVLLREDVLLWEDNLRRKTTFSGRQPSVEDNLQWKTTFGGRWPSVKDDLQWKTTFSGRQPSVEDNLCWKKTIGERWPAVENNLQWKTTFVGSLHAAYSALRQFFHIWILMWDDCNIRFCLDILSFITNMDSCSRITTKVFEINGQG